MRYDSFVSKSLKISRNKALELIENKEVSLNSSFFKPSFNIKNYLLSIDKKSDLSEADLLNSELLKLELIKKIYVSRAAFKLKYFLNEIQLDLKDKICLDIGSSKGGFVEVLLENGVKKVVALDVGSMQLDKSLRENLRVVCVENTDLRSFKSDLKFDFISCDVSFISLLKLLEYIKKKKKKDIILLFKPQFELGIDAKRNKKGLCLDEKEIYRARENFEKECKALCWNFKFSKASELRGKNGNIEYFYYYQKG